MTTVNSMKYLTQRNDARMGVVLPSELKKVIAQKAKRDKMNDSAWVKLAILEKLDRENK